MARALIGPGKRRGEAPLEVASYCSPNTYTAKVGIFGERSFKTGIAGLTMISIIIPTFNRPDVLATCLESLRRLRFPADQLEVVVVDDGGEADLDPAIQRVQAMIDVRLVKQRNTGPAGARNAGVAVARGEFIAFTDDDCIPDVDWLAVLVDRLKQNPMRMFGGRTVNELENNIYSAASQSLIDYLYVYYNADRERARFFTSNNVAMPRTLFDSVGGFDAGFNAAGGEDREFCDRWRFYGHEMEYVPEARVFHLHKLSLGTFWKQHFNYGIGAFRFRKCKSLRDHKPPVFEPLSFYIGLVRYPSNNGLQRPFATSALMVLSQIANAAGFVAAKFLVR